MLTGFTKYSRVPDDIESQQPSVEGETTSHHMLKVLLKEKAYEIRIGVGQTVRELKMSIFRTTGIPPERQRLIFSGKTVGPDQAALSAVGLQADSTIHLFPLREDTPSPSPSPSLLPSRSHPSAVTSSVSVSSLPGASAAAAAGPPGISAFSISRGALGSSSSSADGGDGDGDGGSGLGSIAEEFQHLTAMHFDEEIATNARDVKVWSMVLFLLSLLTVLNNVSIALINHRLGANWLDATVNVAETVASLAGLHVARLGLYSASSMNSAALRDYLWLLTRLGGLCVALRLLWVVDMYITVSKAVADSTQEPAASADHDDVAFSGGVNNDSGVPQGSEPPMDPKMVGTVVAQACIITLLVAGGWAHCYIRAARLRSAVDNFSSDDGHSSSSSSSSSSSRSSSNRSAVLVATGGTTLTGRHSSSGIGTNTNRYTTVTITRNPVPSVGGSSRSGDGNI